MIVTSLNLYKLFLPQMIRIDPRGLLKIDLRDSYSGSPIARFVSTRIGQIMIKSTKQSQFASQSLEIA